MIKMHCSFSADGREFSPRRAESQLGLAFEFKIEKGEKWPRTGRVSDLGYASVGGYGELDQLLSVIEDKVSGLRRLHATDFDLRLDIIHDGQCNFELETKTLGRVARLGCTLSISTHLDEAAFDSVPPQTAPRAD